METTTFHMGHRLRLELDKKGLSVKQLGQKIGMTEQGIHRAFRTEFLSKKVVAKLCQGIGVDANEVFQQNTAINESTVANGIGLDLTKYVADLERQVLEQAVFIEVLLKRGKPKAPRLQAGKRKKPVLGVPLYN